VDSAWGIFVKKTRICDLLEIEYPIVQGGMLWLADAILAAAVSRAGALGLISPLAAMGKNGDPSENLRYQIRTARQFTDKPFGVNIPLDLQQSGILIDVVLKEEVELVVTAAGDPSHYTELLRHNGVIVVRVVSSVKQAQIAESSKVDAIIAEGVEAAGHIGFDELPLFSQIPQVVEPISVPVVAAASENFSATVAHVRDS